MNTNALIVSDNEVTFEFIGSIEAVKDILNDIKDLYPNFENWLMFKFQKSNIELGLRNIIVARTPAGVVGVALLKKQQEERKICTFFVSPSYRKKGIGSQLMELSLDWLETKKPLITVSEERKPFLEPLLRKFNFCQSKALLGFYREDKFEYFYNE